MRYRLYDEDNDYGIVETDAPITTFRGEMKMYKNSKQAEKDGTNLDDFIEWLRDKGYQANLILQDYDDEVYF